MTRIDAHQHFWFYDPDEYGWIDDSMEVLKQHFLPEDLKPQLDHCDIDGCVAVQARQTESETHFLLSLADEFDCIKGVVGWVDLRADDLDERLDHFDRFDKLKGFRHNLEADPDQELIRDPQFQDGIRALHERGYAYDILIHAGQLEQTVRAIDDLPEIPMVIDHLAKPDVAGGAIDEWEQWMRQLSGREHVHCKLSGIVTEADWSDWTRADLVPYLDVACDVFGPDRLMAGSDWPVCTLAAGYSEVIDVVEEFLEEQSSEVNKKVFGETAVNFYNLNP